MRFGNLMKTSGLAAMAATLTLTALPAQAAEAQRSWGSPAREAAQSRASNNRGSQSAARVERQASRSDRGQQNRREARRESKQARSDVRTVPTRNAAPTRSVAQSGHVQNRAVPAGAARYHPADRAQQDHRSVSTAGRSWSTDRNRSSNQNWRDNARRESYDHREDSRSDNNGRYDHDRNDRDRYTRDHRNDRDRYDRDRYDHGRYDQTHGNYRQWSRDWRRDSRYDWSHYRDRNRVTFHIGAYYAPYRNYSYRRLGTGFRLNSLFYSSRYWINDPWQYRLPDAYGPYRWVRYYDDAVLVDIYSGEVVDVIYDFFW